MRALRIAPRSPSESIKPMAAPPPPPQIRRERRRSGFVSRLSGALTFLLVAAVVVGGAFYIGRLEYQLPGPLQEDKIITVRGGSQTVAQTLEREGVISNPLMFVIGLHLYGVKDDIKAGEYLFRQRSSLKDVMDVMVTGKSVLHPITVPEGLTSEQIVARLMENDLLTGEIKTIPPEGSLLPETYRVPRGTPRRQILDKMMADQQRILQEVWQARAPSALIASPEQLVVLASIVEKETGQADERPRVAGVFVNRLQKKMRLQSDPTIVYGLVGGKGTLGRPIQRSEITQATPYNTYVIDGLPPGPIANPGRAALEAVAKPLATKDLYFVADGTGGHAFAETLDQHNRNVARWRQIEASGRASTPAVDHIEPPKDETRGDAAPAGSGDVQRTVAQGNNGPGFDASEGKAFDPLRNTTYDLNSPKTVPPALLKR
ncbi:MAG: endolytic transglycosylase MltG [Chelatococcus sp.]|nr:endolytic transglycosylase MltG [Chelatococcus sp.]